MRKIADSMDGSKCPSGIDIEEARHREDLLKVAEAMGTGVPCSEEEFRELEERLAEMNASLKSLLGEPAQPT